MPNPTKYAPVVQKARMSFETYTGQELRTPHFVASARMQAYALPSIINGHRVYPDGRPAVNDDAKDGQ